MNESTMPTDWPLMEVVSLSPLIPRSPPPALLWKPTARNYRTVDRWPSPSYKATCARPG